MPNIPFLQKLRTRLLLATLAVSFCAIFVLAFIFNRTMQSEIRDRQGAEHAMNLAQAEALLVAASERLESLIVAITKSRQFEMFIEKGDPAQLKEFLFSLKDHDGFLFSDPEGKVLFFNGAWPGRLADGWARNPAFRTALGAPGSFRHAWIGHGTHVYLLVSYLHRGEGARPQAAFTLGLDVNTRLWSVLLASEKSGHLFVLDTGDAEAGHWLLRLRGASPTRELTPIGLTGRIFGEGVWHYYTGMDLQKLGARLHSLQPVAIADAPIYRSRRVIWVAALFTALVLFVALFLLTRKLLERLNVLSEATRRTDQDHLDASVPAGGRDEISQLSQAFNEMLTRIRVAREKQAETNEQLVEEITESYRLNEELEASRRRLAQSRKMESLGKIVGGVVHDFNNILGGIVGHGMILKEILSEERGEAAFGILAGEVEKVIQSAERGAVLNRKLMVFCSLDSSPKSEIDLNACLLQALAENRPRLGASIQVETRFGGSIAAIRGNPDSLRGAFQNLLLNAIEAMPDGGNLELLTEEFLMDETVARETGVNPGRYVHVAIRDSGCGIPPELREQVFEPFLTTKGMGIGTGLGLSFVFGVLRSHEGAVTFQTEVGRGTVFHLYLPETQSPP